MAPDPKGQPATLDALERHLGQLFIRLGTDHTRYEQLLEENTALLVEVRDLLKQLVSRQHTKPPGKVE